MNRYCEVKRWGMYVPNSTCGEYAEFWAEKTYEGGPQSLCKVHALREERSGFKVMPIPPPSSEEAR